MCRDNIWTIKELNLLKELYPTTKSADLASILNKAADTIRGRASKLGIKANNRRKVDVDRMRYLYCDKGLTSSEIAVIEGVSSGAILERLRLHNIPRRSVSESLLLRYTRIPHRKGPELPYYGRPLSEKTRTLLSKLKRGRKLSEGHCLSISEGTKKAWSKLSSKEKMERMLPSLRSINRRPNTIETKLNNLLQQNFPGEWKYVGNGDVVIGELIPDFININGKKQIIELYGTYWHSTEMTTDWRRTELGRIMYYNYYGFRCLVIWENDLIDNPSQVTKNIEKMYSEELTP